MKNKTQSEQPSVKQKAAGNSYAESAGSVTKVCPICGAVNISWKLFCTECDGKFE